MVLCQVLVHADSIFHETLAVLDITSFFSAEILIQSVLRFCGNDHPQPVAFGVLTIGGEYLYLVTAFQLIGQRH